MFAHVHIAIITVLIAWWLGRRLGAPTRAGAWLGVAGTAAICVAREMTQREYQWIEAYGGGLRRNMPWYAGYEVWQWTGHSIAETIVAIMAAALVAMALVLLARRG